MPERKFVFGPYVENRDKAVPQPGDQVVSRHSLQRITSMEVSRGSSRSEGAIRGAEWGTGIGVIMGLLFLPAAHECKTCRNNPSDVGIVAQMTFASATWGAIIGAIAGREVWERMDITPRLTVAAGGRVGLSVALGR